MASRTASRCLPHLPPGTAARSNRAPAAGHPCVGRGDRPRHRPGAAAPSSSIASRRLRTEQIHLHLPAAVERNRQFGVQAEPAGRLRQRLQPAEEEASVALRARSTPSASGGKWAGGVDEQVRQRCVHAVPDQPPHAGGIVAFPFAGRREAGRRRASPAPRWPATGSCSRPPRIPGSAGRTSGPASGRSDRRSRRPAPRVCLRADGASRPTYWAMVPRQDTGNARNKVSSRGSSNPSPMYRPVASSTRPASPGTSASLLERLSQRLLAHAALKDDHVRDAGREVVPPTAPDARFVRSSTSGRSPFRTASRTSSQISRLRWSSAVSAAYSLWNSTRRSGSAGSARPKASRAHDHLVRERPRGRLLSGVDAIPHRAALHEDDRMMAVLARDGGRQAGDEPRLGSAGHLFEAVGRTGGGIRPRPDGRSPPPDRPPPPCARGSASAPHPMRR